MYCMIYISRWVWMHYPRLPCNIPATIAGVGRTAGHTRMLAFEVAFRALGDAIRPTLFLHIFEARIINWKFPVQIGCRIVQIWRMALFELLVRHRLRDRADCPACF